jgi:quinol monooxygenase YgiN
MSQALAQRGCVQCHLATDLTDSDTLHYSEQWSSELDFRAQIPSEHFRRVLAIMEAAAERPRLEVQLVSDTRGLDYIEAVLRGDAS